MRKRTRKTPKPKEMPADQGKSMPQQPLPNDDQKRESNYGGLPNLDLKKNLGCS
jgi:hypothetical protein